LPNAQLERARDRVQSRTPSSVPKPGAKRSVPGTQKPPGRAPAPRFPTAEDRQADREKGTLPNLTPIDSPFRGSPRRLVNGHKNIRLDPTRTPPGFSFTPRPLAGGRPGPFRLVALSLGPGGPLVNRGGGDIPATTSVQPRIQRPRPADSWSRSVGERSLAQPKNGHKRAPRFSPAQSPAPDRATPARPARQKQRQHLRRPPKRMGLPWPTALGRPVPLSTPPRPLGANVFASVTSLRSRAGSRGRLLRAARTPRLPRWANNRVGHPGAILYIREQTPMIASPSRENGGVNRPTAFAVQCPVLRAQTAASSGGPLRQNPMAGPAAGPKSPRTRKNRPGRVFRRQGGKYPSMIGHPRPRRPLARGLRAHAAPRSE